MHIWEGFAKYEIAKIFNVFSNVDKLFPLEYFNRRILAYPYFSWMNKPVPISEQHLKNKLKMSSAETMSFIKYLPLLIGDSILEHHIHWNFLLFIKFQSLPYGISGCTTKRKISPAASRIAWRNSRYWSHVQTSHVRLGKSLVRSQIIQ